jgi:hypothetical protein
MPTPNDSRPYSGPWIAATWRPRQTSPGWSPPTRMVDLGEDVNHADGYGITPLMAPANFGDINIVRYLIDKGADLDAHDLGKRTTATSAPGPVACGQGDPAASPQIQFGIKALF